MKHYFYYVRNIGGFKESDVVYKVAVGDSTSSQVKSDLISEFAKDTGGYYHPVSDTSDKTITLLAESLFLGCKWPRLRLRTAYIKVEELYSMIIRDNFDTYEKNLTDKGNHFHVLNLLDPSFSPKKRPIYTYNTALPSRRKNLKPSERKQFISAIINFGLILAIYWVACLICATEVY